MANILVFDSGVGGLSVVTELRALMPDLHLNYVADDGFRPYGDKTEAALKARLPVLIQSLVLMTKPDAVVLACNTASTAALAEIRDVVSVPVIGAVPAVKPAAKKSKTRTIAILGTPGTIARKYVGQLIEDFAKDCEVVLHGSTALVACAEQKLMREAFDLENIRSEIHPMFQNKNIDIVVLACTHFPLLLDELKQASPYPVSWIDSGQAIAKRTQAILGKINKGSAPNYPQTAFLIGGQYNSVRSKMFAGFGFGKTVSL